MNRIYYFIGFMGAGKSGLADRISERLEIPWADLDDLVEEVSGEEIPVIFRDRGEESFRTLESGLLQKIEYGPLIVATGGGTPCCKENLEYMQQTGRLIYLEAPFDVLYQRIRNDQHRPLIQGLSRNRLKQLFSERLQWYEQAEFQIDVARPQDEIEEDLVELIWFLAGT